MGGVILYYKQKKRIIWQILFVLPLLLSIAAFLWQMEARNLKIRCFPEQTFWACFNSKNIGYTLIGFIVYPICLYPIFLACISAPFLCIEAIIKISKGRNK